MRYELVSEHLRVSINSKGAEISSIQNPSGVEYMWRAKAEVWPRHAPVLFPIVGKLKENLFKYNEHEFSMAQHGFARDLEFELVRSEINFCEFELKASEQTKKAYPFDFVFRILYRLSGKTLTTTYHVTNPSENPLYFSVGAHPGFNCPLLAGEGFEDYYLEFEKDLLHRTELQEGLRLRTTTELKPENGRLALSSALFDKDALVFENSQISRIHLGSKASGRIVTMDCEGWPYFGIWTKKDCREFICLEPWYGIADAQDSNQNLIEKDGIMRLDRGGEFSCSFSISIA